VQAGNIRNNAYSITFVPQKLALPVAREPNIPADRSKDMLMRTSFLTIGGWDKEDYTGDITWFPTGDGWNQTLTEFKFDDEAIIQEYDLTPVMFETGYPYIGLSEQYYDKVAASL